MDREGEEDGKAETGVGVVGSKCDEALAELLAWGMV